MAAAMVAFDEITDLLVSVSPEKLVNYRASDSLQQRYDELAEKGKDGLLSDVEKEELDSILLINRILYLAKIKAIRLAAS